MKVLLAMRQETLPPTANFHAPAKQINLADGPFRVLRESEPWRRRRAEAPRRAAVSGFGFGGINAHVLLEEFRPERRFVPVSPPPRRAAEPIAVVGLDARFGPWQSLSAFRRRVLGGG